MCSVSSSNIQQCETLKSYQQHSRPNELRMSLLFCKTENKAYEYQVVIWRPNIWIQELTDVKINVRQDMLYRKQKMHLSDIICNPRITQRKMTDLTCFCCKLPLTLADHRQTGPTTFFSVLCFVADYRSN